MPHETGTSLTLNPRVAILLLAATATALVVIGTAGQLLTYVWNHNTVFGLVRLFDLSGEGNIPVAFSALLLFLVSLSLALIAALSPAVGPLRSSRWAILSCGFLWMVADEWFELHERLVFPVQGLLGSGPNDLFFFAWIIPGGIVVLVLGAVFLPFVRACADAEGHGHRCAALRRGAPSAWKYRRAPSTPHREGKTSPTT